MLDINLGGLPENRTLFFRVRAGCFTQLSLQPNMVLPRGFEPLSRSNLELAGYKAAVLPLNYRSKLGPEAGSQTPHSAL